jgi:hypothetical protein
MAQLDKDPPVTLQELIISSPCADRRIGEAPD